MITIWAMWTFLIYSSPKQGITHHPTLRSMISCWARSNIKLSKCVYIHFLYYHVIPHLYALSLSLIHCGILVLHDCSSIFIDVTHAILEMMLASRSLLGNQITPSNKTGELASVKSVHCPQLVDRRTLLTDEVLREGRGNFLPHCFCLSLLFVCDICSLSVV